MLLGYYLSITDNDSDFIEDVKKLGKEFLYKTTYLYNDMPSTFIIKNKGLDIGITYYGFVIVSQKFKLLCQEHHFSGLEFLPLPGDTGFYLFRVHNVLEFDSIACMTTFQKYNQ